MEIYNNGGNNNIIYYISSGRIISTPIYFIVFFAILCFNSLCLPVILSCSFATISNVNIVGFQCLHLFFWFKCTSVWWAVFICVLKIWRICVTYLWESMYIRVAPKKKLKLQYDRESGVFWPLWIVSCPLHLDQDRLGLCSPQLCRAQWLRR